MRFTIDTDEIAKGIEKLVSRAPDTLRGFAGQAGNLAETLADQAKKQAAAYQEAWSRYRAPKETQAAEAPAAGVEGSSGRSEESEKSAQIREEAACEETVSIRFNRMSVGAGDSVRPEDWQIPAGKAFMEFLGVDLMPKLPARPNSFWIVRGKSEAGYRDLGLVVFDRERLGRPVSLVGETDVKSLAVAELACICRDGYGQFALGTPEEQSAIDRVLADWNS